MTIALSGTVIYYRETPRRVAYSLFTIEMGIIHLLAKDYFFSLLDTVDIDVSRRGNTFFLQDYIISSTSSLVDCPQNLLPVSYLCSLAKEFFSNTEKEHYFLDVLSRAAQQIMDKDAVEALERLWLKTTGFGRGDEESPTEIILECLPYLQRLRDSF